MGFGSERTKSISPCEEDVLDLDIRLAKAVNHLTIALAEYKKFEKEAIRK